MMEKPATEMGFESAEEMMRLVASVDLTDFTTALNFTAWKLHDGTKEGLLKVLGVQDND
jgi:hypothetical protein